MYSFGLSDVSGVRKVLCCSQYCCQRGSITLGLYAGMSRSPSRETINEMLSLAAPEKCVNARLFR